MLLNAHPVLRVLYIPAVNAAWTALFIWQTRVFLPMFASQLI